MERRVCLAACRLMVCTAALMAVWTATSAWAGSIDLRVMTFNIKNGSPTQENRWEDRRSILKRCVARQDPDIIGTQEGFFFQMKQMAADLPGYAWVGLGRAGGSRGEFMGIFYKTERFEVMAYDHFWLSDTPDVIGSRTWGNTNRRMVTWLRLKEQATGVEFYHWNTHLDHAVQEAREKSAQLIRQRLEDTRPLRPVIVTGDFNATPDDVAHQTLTAESEGAVQLRDAWSITAERVGDDESTYHGWDGSSENPRRIDWILVSPAFRCNRIQVDTYHEEGQYPSDHFPVVADLTLSEP